MKKLTIYTLGFCLLLSSMPNSMMAVADIPTTVIANAPANIQAPLSRLNEIKNMDKTALTNAEKKEIRKEVRQIKTTLRNSGNGIYISVGAAIIIVLLLILIL